AGDYSVRIKDMNGTVLSETTFPVSFTQHSDRQVGIEPTDTIPIFLTVPYPPTAASVAILKNGFTLTTVEANSKLLADGINSLPNCAFAGIADEFRGKLLDDVANVAAAIKNNLANSSLQSLVGLLQTHYQTWVTNACSVSNSLQLTAGQVSQLVSESGSRILSSSGAGVVVTPPVQSIFVDKNVLTFAFERGGLLPSPQVVSVSGDRGVSIAPQFFNTSWLTVTPSANQIPAQLSISVNPAGMNPGYYASAVFLAGAAAKVTVLLHIIDPPRLNTSRTNLDFNYTFGGQAP